MAFIDSFDEMLNQILTDHQAQDPGIDISPATLTFIKSACFASALWGVAIYLKGVARKPFPDQCFLDDLKHWAIIKGVQNIDSYIDADGNYSLLVAEVLNRMQHPESGGNETDWPRWAKDCVFDHGDWVEHVIWAKAWEDKRYTGSVDVVVVSDTPSTVSDEQTPTSDLLSVLNSYLDEQRSLGVASGFVVSVATKIDQAVSLQVSSGSVEATPAVLSQLQDAVISYIKSLKPGDTLYPAQLEAIIINGGLNIVSNSLASPVIPVVGPDVYERIWPMDASVLVYI